MYLPVLQRHFFESTPHWLDWREVGWWVSPTSVEGIGIAISRCTVIEFTVWSISISVVCLFYISTCHKESTQIEWTMNAGCGRRTKKPFVLKRTYPLTVLIFFASLLMHHYSTIPLPLRHRWRSHHVVVVPYYRRRWCCRPALPLIRVMDIKS